MILLFEFTHGFKRVLEDPATNRPSRSPTTRPTRSPTNLPPTTGNPTTIMIETNQPSKPPTRFVTVSPSTSPTETPVALGTSLSSSQDQTQNDSIIFGVPALVFFGAMFGAFFALVVLYCTVERYFARSESDEIWKLYKEKTRQRSCGSTPQEDANLGDFPCISNPKSLPLDSEFCLNTSLSAAPFRLGSRFEGMPPRRFGLPEAAFNSSPSP